MIIEVLEKTILKNLEKKDDEVLRLFHGRGGLYEGLEFLTIDSLDTLLYVAFFKEISLEFERQILALIVKLAQKYAYKTIVLQRRYLKHSISEVIKGSIPLDFYVKESGLKYLVHFDKQNIGLFFDMKNGRDYIRSISKDKKVLNLFSYTCAFSVSAKQGGAKSVVNVDMSKGALSIGRKNHHLNNLDTKDVHFMPYNILKSWSRIRKKAPYDIIIIDPPSFQKGSFEASRDYERLLKKIDELSSKSCIVFACLNDPLLNSDFLKNKFKKLLPNFRFVKRLENLEEFLALDEEKSLKNFIFTNITESF